jgi:hypothetical protein
MPSSFPLLPAREITAENSSSKCSSFLGAEQLGDAHVLRAVQITPCDNGHRGRFSNRGYLSDRDFPRCADPTKYLAIDISRATITSFQGGKTAGFAYIMSNPSFRAGRLKIGKSDRDPSEFRKQELETTGIPEPLVVEFAIFVVDHHALEREVHARLDTYRVNKNREFFGCDLHFAALTIRQAAGKNILFELKRENPKPPNIDPVKLANELDNLRYALSTKRKN